MRSRREALRALTAQGTHDNVDPVTFRRARVAAYAAAAAAGVPAPSQYSVVYDGGAGYNAGSTDSRSVGQYADTNTNTVHTTRGFSQRDIAQDVGQIFANGLTPGDRNFFSKLLGTDPANWTDLHSNSPKVMGVDNEAGNEAFSNYYSVAATGGMKHGEGLLIGNTGIDPDRLRKFTAAMQRLGKRYGLHPYAPQPPPPSQ